MSKLPNLYFVPNDDSALGDPQVYMAMGRTAGDRLLFAAEYDVSSGILEVILHGIRVFRQEVHSATQAALILEGMFPNAEHYEILLDPEAQL